MEKTDINKATVSLTLCGGGGKSEKYLRVDEETANFL